jgi:cytochrome oxidase Cu insertion factor (SCO1/SenC/PrrC family)
MNRNLLLLFSILMFVGGGLTLAVAIKRSFPVTGGGTQVGEAFKDPEKPVRLVAENEPWLKSFELTDRSERKIGSADLAGKIHVVSFFFATCPASCKTQNHTLSNLVREFGKEGVKFLAITCDPETDTPAKLREYASTNYNAPQDSWYFLTGDLLYTRRIAAEIYEVSLDRKSHVEKFILVNQSGKIIGKYAWADDKELLALKREITSLLQAEKAAEKKYDVPETDAEKTPPATSTSPE